MAQPLRVPRRPSDREASRLVVGSVDGLRGVGGVERRRSTVIVDSIIGVPPVGLRLAREEGQRSFAKSRTRLLPFVGSLENSSPQERVFRLHDFPRSTLL